MVEPGLLAHLLGSEAHSTDSILSHVLGEQCRGRAPELCGRIDYIFRPCQSPALVMLGVSRAKLKASETKVQLLRWPEAGGEAPEQKQEAVQPMRSALHC